ncbi:ATP-binding protein [Streptomyces sp. CA-278952]|uniref:ATP-binding protein n=1 Tax=Streptomyces sp. CA-278952 TaxID=2980556 RepID=UPI002368AB21|nr:ATP-binding protein [Streptomyces sp. CA-278952]WDG31730.1 ATP-binding protein [Streptomyces sp. CA-278952]
MSSQSFFLVRARASAAISRRRLVELVSTWRLPEDEDSHMAMTTVVSELVTNAVSHGTGDMLSVTVRADLGKSRLLLEVHDSSPVLPRLRCPSPDSESGRGMVLVEHLSIACGAENTVRGKRVWAELSLPREQTGRRWALDRLGPPHAIVQRFRNAFRPLFRTRSGQPAAVSGG